MMDFIKSIAIAATGMRAQGGRMRIISENIANADSTATTPGGNPYRRRIVTFRSELDRDLGAHVVAMGRVATDNSDFQVKHEPDNPVADANGDVTSQCESADRDDRFSRRAAFIRSQPECHQRHQAHAPAHTRHHQDLKGNS